MNFIYHFAGGSPETNQYFFDLQALLKTEAPIEDNPDEDPCEAEEDIELPDLELRIYFCCYLKKTAKCEIGLQTKGSV